MQQLLNGGVERLLSLLYSVRSGLWLDRYAEEPRVRVMKSIANYVRLSIGFTDMHKRGG